ncbi:MAG: alpha/beta hydrolase [Oxalobacter sp.]|nr:alpha/beta hydrolase [Oxalobacter sp.]
MSQVEPFFISGAAGTLECLREMPEGTPVGIALIAHPHPLYGGDMHNKVVQTMARAFSALGYIAVRMNCRGVGMSQGTHDGGKGEAEDMALLLAQMQADYPGLSVVLGGYSFGTYVQSLLCESLGKAGKPQPRMILVSATAGMWTTDTVPADTVLIHGDLDEMVPLRTLLDWARPQGLTVNVITGADHFYNRRLLPIRDIITAHFLKT